MTIAILSVWVFGLTLMLFCERLAKLIPDSEKGALGGVRKALKVLGGYVDNIR